MSAVTVTTRTCAGSNCVWRRASDGISSLQGPHQVAQKFRSTTFPDRSSERTVSPSSALRSNGASGAPVVTRVMRSAANGSPVATVALYRRSPEPNTTAQPTKNNPMSKLLGLWPMSRDSHFSHLHYRQSHGLNDEPMCGHRMFFPTHHNRALMVDCDCGCLSIFFIEFPRYAERLTSVERMAHDDFTPYR